MCDPISIGIGLIGGVAASKALTPKTPKVEAVTPVDAEAETAKARATATANANAEIVSTQRRRRTQNNLLALGGNDDTLGGGTAVNGGGPLGLGGMSGPAMSNLLAAGSITPAGATPVGGGGGGGGRSTGHQRVAAY